MSKKNLLVLLAVSLPPYMGCVGNSGDDTEPGNGDDTGNPLAFEATIRVSLPADAPADTQVTIGGAESGWAAVVECDGTECANFAALEPDTYVVRAESAEYYFAELTVVITEDGQTEDAAWTKGGCADPEWSVGDGECEWVNGQYGCDVAGFWKGVEDEAQDVRGDIVMAVGDEDGDGILETLVVGGDDSEDLVGFVIPPLNISGTVMNIADHSMGWRYAQMVTDESNTPGNCNDTMIRVVGDGYEYHMELYEE